MGIKELLFTRKRMWELEPIDQIKRIVLVGIIFFTILFGLQYMVFDPLRAVEGKAEAYEKIVSVESRVDLGVMGSSYERGRHVKRIDAVATGLRTLLESELSSYDYSPNRHIYIPPTGCIERYTVVAVNGSETQVMLRNACYGTSYASRKDGSWRMVERVRFDRSGLPICGDVDELAVDKEIAPVCSNWKFEQDDAAPTYTIR